MFGTSPTMHRVEGKYRPGLRSNRAAGRSRQCPAKSRTRAPENETIGDEKSSPGQFSQLPESVMWTSPKTWWKPKNLPGKIGMGSSRLLIRVTHLSCQQAVDPVGEVLIPDAGHAVADHPRVHACAEMDPEVDAVQE